MTDIGRAGHGRRRRGGLIWHRDFRLLWTGDTISQFGSEISVLALPLVAVLTLHASTFEVGVLTAVQYAAFLLVGLPAGAWCDRIRRRPVMIATDAIRAALLASIPIAAALGVLTLGQLLTVALLLGLATVFFDVAYQSYLPSLVDHADLVEGNAKLQASQSVAHVTGPTVGGYLVQLFTAPFAILADAASFALSAVSVGMIRTAEPAPPRPPQRNLVREVGEGLRFVLRHPVLRMIAATTGTSNLFNAAFGAVVVVFFVRGLDLAPGTIGALMSAGSVGGIVGALSVGWVTRRIGQARTIWVSLVVTTPLALLIPLTQRGAGLALFVVGYFAFSYGVVLYNVAQVSFRQALCPPALLGRMNATMRFLVWGTMPLGGLLGGALGTVIGLRPTLWVTTVGGVLATGWVLASPLRTLRDLPSAAAGEPSLSR
jgi:MFS family permease